MQRQSHGASLQEPWTKTLRVHNTSELAHAQNFTHPTPASDTPAPHLHGHDLTTQEHAHAHAHAHAFIRATHSS